MNKKEQMIMIGDFGKDLDDENALLYSLGAMDKGEIELAGIVANLQPAEQRASLVTGILDRLDFDIQVGVGTSCGQTADAHEYEMNVPYLSDVEAIEGRELMLQILDDAPSESVTLILNSGMTDMAQLIEADPSAVLNKVRRVAIMGGVGVKNSAIELRAGKMYPDDSANNMFDYPASEYVYEWLQTERVPMSILSRYAAYACKFDLSFYQELANTGMIGTSIYERHKPSMESVWSAACSPPASEGRGSLPDRCDRTWFVDTYLGGNDPGTDDMWAQALTTGTFQLYDVLNVATLVTPHYFDAETISVRGVKHQIFGISPDRHGIRDAKRLRDHAQAMILSAAQRDAHG